MRWDALFADLEAQAEAFEAEELQLRTAEAVDLERSRVVLADRLRAHIGKPVTMHCSNGQVLPVVIGTVGHNWCSGLQGAGSCLVALSAVVAIDRLGFTAVSEASTTHRRLGMTAPLRRLAQDRAEVSVYTQAGEIARGVLHSVGQDHLDIITAGSILRTVSLQAVVSVHSVAADFMR